MVDSMPDSAIYACMEVFKTFDSSGDGNISADELKVAMKRVGLEPGEEELRAMVAECDVDGDGEISFPEFLVMCARKQAEADTEDEIREAFQIIDKDGSGTIDRDELRTLFEELGENITDDALDEMFAVANLDGDDEIGYDEFKVLMMSGALPT